MSRKSKLVVLAGWKYEPEWLVEDMKKNLHWVDDFAIVDCRDRDELWIHEGDYRLKAREMAREMKADWCLWTSPDERWEDRAGEIIRPLIDYDRDMRIYEFLLRELVHPLWYRSDGIWATKFRRRLFPLRDDQIMRYQPIQVGGVPHGDFPVDSLDINIYHLKMIEPENRRIRAEVFNALDPKGIYQPIGYDYLDDEREATVERIPGGREYSPPYTKPYYFKVPQKYLDEARDSNNVLQEQEGD